MTGPTRPACPLPYLGRYVYERGNFWDEARRESSGLWFEEYEAWQETAGPQGDCPASSTGPRIWIEFSLTMEWKRKFRDNIVQLSG